MHNYPHNMSTLLINYLMCMILNLLHNILPNSTHIISTHLINNSPCTIPDLWSSFTIHLIQEQGGA